MDDGGIDEPEDVITIGRPPARRAPLIARGTAGLVALAVVAGLIVEHQAGRHHRGPVAIPTPASTPSAAALPFTSAVIAETGNICSGENETPTGLQLGTEIVNRSPGPVVLDQIVPVLPLGGLRLSAVNLSFCNALPIAVALPETVLAAGASTWISATFTVLDGCPQALPVGFDLTYTQDGAVRTAQLRPFPDLGSIIYSGCLPSTAAGG